MKRNIALIGGQGRIGALLAKKFSQNGDSVFTVDVTANSEAEASEKNWLSPFRKSLHELPILDGVVFCFRPAQETSKTTESTQQICHYVSASLTTLLESINILGPKLNAKNGCFIDLNSTNSTSISSQPAEYHISKAAANQLFKYYSVHPPQPNLKFYSIAIGIISLPNNQNTEIEKLKRDFMKKVSPNSRPISIEDLFDCICFLLAQDSRAMSGHMIELDGGLKNLDHFYAHEVANFENGCPE